MPLVALAVGNAPEIDGARRRRILHRQAGAPYAVERFQRARHRAGGGDQTDLADAFRAERAFRFRVLDQNDLDLRAYAAPATRRSRAA